MSPDRAKAIYDLFVQKIKQSYQPEKVKDGVFQAMMQVSLPIIGNYIKHLMIVKAKICTGSACK